MAARLTGSLYTYQAHVLYVGPLIASARHEHHAGQVLWAPGGVVVHGEGCSERRVATHLVPPNMSHGHGAAAAAAVLWVDSGDLSWDRVLPTSWDVSSTFPCAVGARLGESLAREEAREVAQALLDVARASQGHAPLHPAVSRMRALLDAAPCDREPRIAELAQQSGLSVRQLRHRFTQELGLNPRAYRRWRRLRQTIASIQQGATLTQAALDSGFADSAHLCRVFHVHFGMAPSQALSSVHFAGSLD